MLKFIKKVIKENEYLSKIVESVNIVKCSYNHYRMITYVYDFYDECGQDECADGSYKYISVDYKPENYACSHTFTTMYLTRLFKACKNKTEEEFKECIIRAIEI